MLLLALAARSRQTLVLRACTVVLDSHHIADLPWRNENAGTVGGAASHLLAASIGALFDHLQHTLGRAYDPVGSSTQTSELQLLGREATFDITVKPPPPGTARIRFVVRDTLSGRVGATDSKP